MRRLRVRSLYHREHIKKLRRLQRSGQACVARWATILLLFHQGRGVHATRIAAGMGLHVQTVRTRIRTFNRAEPTWRWDLLRPPRRPGRTPTYGLALQQGLVDLLKQSPEQFGLDSGVWRLHDFAVALARLPRRQLARMTAGRVGLVAREADDQNGRVPGQGQ